MSADRQRLKSAIRRIALTPEERRQLLGEGQNKGGKPSSSGVGTSEAASEEVEQCCGSGTSIRDPDAESQDGLDSDDPANLDMGAGSLTGLTDCSTGEPVCFNGSGFIPPDGWDAPDDPPPEEGYEEGFYWGEGELSPDNECRRAYSESNLTESHTYLEARPNSEFGGYGCWVKRLSDGAEQEFLITFKSACDGSGICDKPIPLEEAWPSDGCVNLAIKGGTIVGSKYDPDQDGSYSKPLAEINLCDGAGNQIRLAPSADGGWKTLDAINGGDGYLYDSQGQQIARISGDEFSDPTI